VGGDQRAPIFIGESDESLSLLLYSAEDSDPIRVIANSKRPGVFGIEIGQRDRALDLTLPVSVARRLLATLGEQVALQPAPIEIGNPRAHPPDPPIGVWHTQTSLNQYAKACTTNYAR
jgi:hypothetical protein